MKIYILTLSLIIVGCGLLLREEKEEIIYKKAENSCYISSHETSFARYMTEIVIINESSGAIVEFGNYIKSLSPDFFILKEYNKEDEIEINNVLRYFSFSRIQRVFIHLQTENFSIQSFLNGEEISKIEKSINDYSYQDVYQALAEEIHYPIFKPRNCWIFFNKIITFEDSNLIVWSAPWPSPLVNTEKSSILFEKKIEDLRYIDLYNDDNILISEENKSFYYKINDGFFFEFDYLISSSCKKENEIIILTDKGKIISIKIFNSKISINEIKSNQNILSLEKKCNGFLSKNEESLFINEFDFEHPRKKEIKIKEFEVKDAKVLNFFDYGDFYLIEFMNNNINDVIVFHKETMMWSSVCEDNEYCEIVSLSDDHFKVKKNKNKIIIFSPFEIPICGNKPIIKKIK